MIMKRQKKKSTNNKRCKITSTQKNNFKKVVLNETCMLKRES